MARRSIATSGNLQVAAFISVVAINRISFLDLNGANSSSYSLEQIMTDALVSLITYSIDLNGCLVHNGTAIPPARQIPHCNWTYSKLGVTRKAIRSSSKSSFPANRIAATDSESANNC